MHPAGHGEPTHPAAVRTLPHRAEQQLPPGLPSPRRVPVRQSRRMSASPSRARRLLSVIMATTLTSMAAAAAAAAARGGRPGFATLSRSATTAASRRALFVVGGGQIQGARPFAAAAAAAAAGGKYQRVRPRFAAGGGVGATPASTAPAFPEVSYAESDKPLGEVAPVGHYARIMSQAQLQRDFKDMSTLTAADAGQQVWIRARVQNVRAKGNSCFLVLRQGPFHTMQACYFKDKSDPEGSKAVLKFLGSLTAESVIDVQGTLQAASVKSCSVNDVELGLSRAYVVSSAEPILPFQLEDAGRPEAEVEASQATERPFPRIGQELRLDNRWLDLRVPANNCIMRIQSAVCQLFREALYAEGFVEIHTPKLIGGESEGGAGVFRTDYFGRPACLAQSPQLYKQMAVSADLDRVFEVGPVFRAENSNTRRHLCEFTGLDLEMAIREHYNEVLGVSHRMFKHIFEGLESRHAKELAIIRGQYESEPVAFTEEACVVHWPEAMALLREAGAEGLDEFGDLSGAQELKLGELVKAKYGTDFFILDKYPSAVRPFYTMPCPEDPRYSNSYDMFLRGQEICSGAQRIHDPALLEEQIAAKGIPVEPLLPYVTSFRHGVSPHAGAGIGLERVVFLYLGLDNVRKASMFPRDPNRVEP